MHFQYRRQCSNLIKKAQFVIKIVEDWNLQIQQLQGNVNTPPVPSYAYTKINIDHSVYVYIHIHSVFILTLVLFTL